MIVYLNGDWVDEQDARISIHDRGFLLADGIFETARLVRRRYFKLPQHLARLADSARMLQIPLPALEDLRGIAEDLAARNDLEEATLRITVTRGQGGRGLDTRGAGPPTVLAHITPLPADWYERAGRGWHLVTARVRRPSPLSVPSELKALGRVYALLAHLEAEAAGADDALLLTADGNVGEGPTWNFFWRTGRHLRTAALAAGVLQGVTRNIVMDLAARENYEVEEGIFPPAELETAEEAFATMTSSGVVPIRSLDGRAFTSDRCAAVLQRRYWEYVENAVQSDGPVPPCRDGAGPL